MLTQENDRRKVLKLHLNTGKRHQESLIKTLVNKGKRQQKNLKALELRRRKKKRKKDSREIKFGKSVLLFR